MAARRNPAAEKAAANQQVIKSLLKLPGNKLCADCKRNKLPRWASWNLGIFICIRCSGIHRGMGTHISRVKSVDLDSWTDEQVQSMVKWGNTRANKYWEANLAPGHIPSEAKIENFVRTKYESKRWVMDGPMPDPSTLGDDGEGDELPLKVVKQQLEHRQTPAPSAATVAPPQLTKSPVNLFDDDPEPVSAKPPGPAATATAASKTQVAPKAEPAPPKQSKPGDSLLGLDDFFGAPQQATPRPHSTGPTTTTAARASSRPDLNRSILSLYSSTPKPQGKPTSPSLGSPTTAPAPQASAFGDLSDAFGGLSFAASPQQPQLRITQPPKPSPFANLTSPLHTRSGAAPQLSSASSGGFFGPASAHKKVDSFGNNQNRSSAASNLSDLFSLSSTTSNAAPPPAPASVGTNSGSKPMSSAFAFENAWASTSSTAAAPVSTTTNVWSTNTNTTNNASAGLGTSSLASNKKDDDEFGAFTGGGTSSTGIKVDDDLFANVWS